MGATGELLMALGKTIGLMIATLIVFAVGLIVFLDLWAKKAVQNRIYAIFLEHKQLFSKLLKIDGDKIYLGRGEKKEEYLLDTSKQFWAWWPAGMPRTIQIPVRAHWYIRNQPNPVDPENMEATLSARSMMMITDEGMLRQTWKDIRESTGLGPAKKSSGIALILIFVTLALVGFNIYMTMQLKDMVIGLGG